MKNNKKDKSTILLDKDVINLLKEAKEHPKQTYDEIIKKMSEFFINAKKEIQEELKEKEEEEKEKIQNSINGSLYREKI
jgi:rRNA-processing protein FCF1